MGAMYVLACADKFRGTLTAPEFGAAVAAGAEAVSYTHLTLPTRS